jgi:multiple sugar transport system permease protein
MFLGVPRRSKAGWNFLSQDRRFRIFILVAAIFVFLWTMIPFFWMFWASLMTEAELVQGIVQMIDEPSFGHYRRIFGIAETDALSGGQTKQLSLALLNSFVVALPTAIIATAIAILAGYAFGRFTFPGQRSLLFTLLLTRVLPPIAILIPYYAFFQSIGMIGTHASLILTYLPGIIPLLAWLLMGYFATLPVNVERAARIDGCSRLQALWYVIIPMALPGISAAFIIAFLFAYNELLFAIILTGGSSAQTLSPSLQAISQNIVLLTAASTLSVIPPFLLALLFQKYFTRLNVVDPTTTP